MPLLGNLKQLYIVVGNALVDNSLDNHIYLRALAIIGCADKVGTVEIGKQADLLVWNAPSLNYIFYRYGNNLVDTVIKKGKIVKSK